jgi:molybdopterin synthase catalytic subunit
MFRLTDAPIVIDELLTAVADPTAGAVVRSSTTRDHNDGRSVERPSMRSAGMAEKEIEPQRRRRAAGRSRGSPSSTAPGSPIGMASVAIAVSAAHRGPAFDAARFTIDRLKEVVPILKKEFFAGGAVWIGDQSGSVGTWSDPAVPRAPSHDRES